MERFEEPGQTVAVVCARTLLEGELCIVGLADQRRGLRASIWVNAETSTPRVLTDERG
jgi:hypothetical protein